MTRYPTLFAAAGLLVVTLPAWAAPSCTGTTTVITASPTTLQAASLVDASGQSNGNCVAVGDKLFGGFTFGTAGSQLPFADEIVEFDWPTATPFVGSYQLSFSTNLRGASSASGFGFEVSTDDPTVALINELQKDGAFNGVPDSSISLAGLVNGVQLVTCSRTFDGPQNCPADALFTPIQDVLVREAVVVSAGAILSNITDTISQVAPAQVPEPSSLLLLGAALAGFAWIRRRQQSGAL